MVVHVLRVRSEAVRWSRVDVRERLVTPPSPCRRSPCRRRARRGWACRPRARRRTACVWKGGRGVSGAFFEPLCQNTSRRWLASKTSTWCSTRGSRAVLDALGPRTYLTTTLCSDLVTTSPSKVTRPCLRSALASERLHTPCLWRCGRAAFEHFGFGILTDERGRTDVGFALGVPGEDFVHAVGLVHGRASGPVRHEHPPLLHALVLLRSDDDPLVVLLPQLLLRERRHHRGIKRRGLGTRLFEACRIARGARGRERSGSGSSRSSGTRRGCKCAGQGMERRAVCERRSRVATLIRMSRGTAVGFGASGFPASTRPITRATVTNPDRRSVFLRRAPNRKTETKLDRRNERAKNKKNPEAVGDRDEIMRAGRRVRIYPDYCRRRG